MSIKNDDKRTMSDELRAKRLELLRQELELNLGTLWFEPAHALEDIYYALSPPVHEGRYPSYGAIVIPHETLSPTGSDVPLHFESALSMPSKFSAPMPQREVHLDGDRVEQARLFADGRSTFLVRTPSTVRMAAFSEEIGDEFSLSSLAIKSGGVVVQRDHAGFVRIFTRSYNYSHKERQWSSTPLMDGDVSFLLFEPPLSNFPEMLCSILRFAYYNLSPAKIGATLVWCLHERVIDPSKIPEERDVRWAQLSLTRRGDLPALQQLLSQKDGATMIDPAGNVVAVGVHLAPKGKAEFLPKHTGTRHTSARQYSFDVTESIVTVVSSDGPVSIFSDGMSARELIQFGRPLGAGQEVPIPVGERRKPWLQDMVECTTCKKRSLLHRLQALAEYQVRQAVLCPVCKDPLFEAECGQLQARVIKCIEP